MPELKYFKLFPNVLDPIFATQNAACFDIFCHWEPKQKIKGYRDNSMPFSFETVSDLIEIPPFYRIMIPTGLIFDIPTGYSVRLHPRSGVALKQGLTLVNCEPVIDDDYFQETFILLINVNKYPIQLDNNTRICQGELVEKLVYTMFPTSVKPQQKTDRIGGLGSTGV